MKKLFLLLLAGLLIGYGCSYAPAPATTPILQVQQKVSPALPLKRIPGQKYIVDQNGVPVLINAWTEHTIVTNIDPNSYATIMSTRAAMGFNAVQVQILVNAYIHNPTACTFDGICPFSTTGSQSQPADLSSPNDAYFARLDAVIAAAASNNVVVFLTPLDEAGWADPGVPNNTLHANSAGGVGHTKLYGYGQYLGNRYKNSPNIVWQFGNDFQDWCSTSTTNGLTDDQMVLEIGNGIKSTDTVSPKPSTIELAYLISSSIDDPAWAAFSDFNGVYTYAPVYARTHHDYGVSSLPSIMIESFYNGEGNPPASWTAAAHDARKQAWWSILAGASGTFYGNNGDYDPSHAGGFNPVAALSDPSAVEVGYLSGFFARIPWWTLVPDRNSNTIVTSGFCPSGSSCYDTTENGCANGCASCVFSQDSGEVNYYATTARSTDGRYIVSYMPSPRVVTVNLAQMSISSFTAQWFNPAANTYTSIGTFTNVGSHQFTPPPATPEQTANCNDSDGSKCADWVLLLSPLSGTDAGSDANTGGTTSTGGVTGTGGVTSTGGTTSTGGVTGTGGVTSTGGTTSTGGVTGTGGVTSTGGTTSTGGVTGTGGTTGGSTPIVFIQQNNAVPQSSPTTVAVPFSLPQGAGDLNIVVVGWNDSARHVSSVVDTKGNSYSLAVGPTIVSGTLSQSIYYAPNIVAASANTVTVTFNGGAAFPDIRILEYSGIATASPVDKKAAATGTGTSSNSGNLTTTTAHDLLFAANTITTTTSGPGTGYTKRVITWPDGDIAEDRVVTAIGTYNATAPISSGKWIMQLVAFKGIN